MTTTSRSGGSGSASSRSLSAIATKVIVHNTSSANVGGIVSLRVSHTEMRASAAAIDVMAVTSLAFHVAYVP